MDKELAFKWLMKSAEQGLKEAQYQVGTQYYLGNGIQKDFTKAAEWIGKAAQAGDAEAQYDLGSLYSDGEGVPKDLAQAFD